MTKRSASTDLYAVPPGGQYIDRAGRSLVFGKNLFREMKNETLMRCGLSGMQIASFPFP
jgi:hypothetical protein